MHPKNPAAEAATRLSGHSIQRDPGHTDLWSVRLASDPEPHWVERLDGFYLPVGAPARLVCSCSASSCGYGPGCDHTRTLAAFLRQHGERAQARRRGLTYSGRRLARNGDTPRVTVRQHGVARMFDWELLHPQPSQALRNHSPSGFEWGYAGSGPAQLALAILLDYTADAATALRHYQEFKAACIAPLPRDSGPWQITGAQIQRFLFRDLQGAMLPEVGRRGAPSRCYLRWMARAQHVCGGRPAVDDSIVVVATDLAGNPAAPVAAPRTGRGERLAGQVCRELEIAPERLIWIEHDLHPRESFRLVAFHLQGGHFHAPRALAVSRPWVENLIGQPLPPLPEGCTRTTADG